MKRYTGSEMVEPGLYFNPRQLSFKSVDEEGPLPGSTDEVYRRVPSTPHSNASKPRGWRPRRSRQGRRFEADVPGDILFLQPLVFGR